MKVSEAVKLEKYTAQLECEKFIYNINLVLKNKP